MNSVLKSLLVSCMLMFLYARANAQSKRDQIESLNHTVNSLKSTIEVLISESVDQQLSLGAEIKSLKTQMDDCELQQKQKQLRLEASVKSVDQLTLENTGLKLQLTALQDSLRNCQVAISDNEKGSAALANNAYKGIRNKWDYFLEAFGDSISLSKLRKNELNVFCNEERCVKFFYTNIYFIASYRVNEVVESETVIIRIADGKNIVRDDEKGFFMDSFDMLSGVLKVEMEGYDSEGRYSRAGIFDSNTEILKLGSKQY